MGETTDNINEVISTGENFALLAEVIEFLKKKRKKEENKENGTPDGYYLGYAILPKWRKKGLAAKAASRLLKYCFEYWQLKEVYLLCSSENIASVKTALSCGFTKMSSIEVPIQNSVFPQNVVEHCLNDCACVSTSLLFLFARKAL